MLALRVALTVGVVALGALIVTTASAQGPPISLGTYTQSGTLQLEFGVDERGTVDRETGLIRVGGTLSCNEPAVVDEFFGYLFQGQNEAAIDPVTDGCSGRWTATVVPYPHVFHPGKATFFIQVGMINDTGFAGYFDVTGAIVLRPGRLSEQDAHADS